MHSVGSMTPRWTDIALHIGRLSIGIAGLAISAHASCTAGMIAMSVALFLAAFALNHDLAHNALVLPPRANELALAMAGGVMLMSGHAIRATHLRHHLHPLAVDDAEGAAARMSFTRALFTAPAQAMATRCAGYQFAIRRDRSWQRVETMATLTITMGLLATGLRPLAVFVLVALTAQITMPVWAAHIPHNAPEWLVGIARILTFTRSPTVLSLAYHELHHARPRVPCRRLHDEFENRATRADAHTSEGTCS